MGDCNKACRVESVYHLIRYLEQTIQNNSYILGGNPVNAILQLSTGFITANSNNL